MCDGNKSPDLKNYEIKKVIKGDEKIPEISAASIIAKVSRERQINEKMSAFLKIMVGIKMLVMEPKIILKLLKNLE